MSKIQRAFATVLVIFIAFYAKGTCQKTPYIPLYLQDPQDVNGQQFSWDKTAQSNNFKLIWGNTSGSRFVKICM